MKDCTICNISKDFSMFNKNKHEKDGLERRCKSCRKEYYSLNKEHTLNRVKKYYKENKEKYFTEKSIKKRKECTKNWRSNNKEQMNNYAKLYHFNERRNNPLFKIKHNIRNRINKFIKNKSKTSLDIIGCSFEELKIYLESKFKIGMSWDNYGEWHIDHIIPLASAKTEEEIYKLCHHLNLQPLWAIENMSKGSRY